MLVDNQSLDDAPHTHSIRVGGDVDETLLAERVKAPLLRFDRLHFLEKCRCDLAIERFRRLGVVLPVAVGR